MIYNRETIIEDRSMGKIKQFSAEDLRPTVPKVVAAHIYMKEVNETYYVVHDYKPQNLKSSSICLIL
jgi:hypothetical protein